MSRATEQLVTRDADIDGPTGRLFTRTVEPAGGSTNAIILAHGAITSSIPAFDIPSGAYSTMHELAWAGFSCTAFDLRGYGRSYKPAPDSPSMTDADVAADLRAVYDMVLDRATSITIFALSVTCAGAMQVASARPRALTSLIFMGPLYDNPKEPDRANEFLRRSANSTYYRRINYAEYYDTWMKGDEPEIDLAIFNEYFDLAKDVTDSPRSEAAVVCPVRLFPEARPYFDVSDVPCPLLVLRGSKDHLCSAEDARLLIERAPAGRVRLVELEGKRHVLGLYREHDDYANALASFVTEAHAKWR